MVTAVYPGTFDPVTLGHVDVASRAALLFEKVIVAVYATPSKDLLFTTDERIDLLRRSVVHLPNVEVLQFEGLVVRFARDVEAAVIVRGLRSGSDFEYEFEMAAMNRRLAKDVDMVSFMTSQDHMFLSSSLLKEVARLGGDVTSMVPPHVADAVYTKYGRPGCRRVADRKGDIIDIINVIDRLETLINTSKVMPVTGSLMIDRQKIIELVDQLRLEIPQEMKAAAEVLSQKDQIMNSAVMEARRTKSKAEEEFRERLSQSEFHRKAEETLREAEQRAAKVVEQAESQAQLRHTEADAYALASLRALERELNSISGSVRKGIDMLAGNALVNSVNSPAGRNGPLD